jgi:solute carrier family 25, member 33/36
MTAAIVTAPFDVLKTRLQSDLYRTRFLRTDPLRRSFHFSSLRSSILHCHEAFQSLFSISRVEGWRVLFRGLGPTLAGFVPASAIKFYVYGNSKRIISDTMNKGEEAAWVHLLAAISAGVVVSTATNPIWLVKTRLQLDKSNSESLQSTSTRQYKNSLDCAVKVFQNEGVKGLYKGLSASYLGISESALQWILYEQMKMYLAKMETLALSTSNDQGFWNVSCAWGGKIGAAGGAKLLATIVTYPHEVITLFILTLLELY